MKNILIAIRGVWYHIIGMTWIVTPGNAMCNAVPVYFVEVKNGNDVE